MDGESGRLPFEPSLVDEAVPQSSVLDSSGYAPTVERTVQEFDEVDFQSKWNGVWGNSYIKRAFSSLENFRGLLFRCILKGIARLVIQLLLDIYLALLVVPLCWTTPTELLESACVSVVEC